MRVAPSESQTLYQAIRASIIRARNEYAHEGCKRRAWSSSREVERLWGMQRIWETEDKIFAGNNHRADHWARPLSLYPVSTPFSSLLYVTPSGSFSWKGGDLYEETELELKRTLHFVGFYSGRSLQNAQDHGKGGLSLRGVAVMTETAMTAKTVKTATAASLCCIL